MYIAGQKDMQLLDQYTIEKLGLPGIVLMENAGASVVHEVLKDFPSRETKITVFAGGGNNGGDGFVIGRRLIDHGYPVKLFLAVSEQKIKGDAKIHFDVYKNRHLPLTEDIDEAIQSADVLIDALLGTGIQGEIKSPFLNIMKAINEAQKIVYAVDVPSGVNANTGEVLNIAVKATKTISFVLPKSGFYLQQGPQYVGQIRIADISVPTDIVKKLKLNLPQLIDHRIAEIAKPRRVSNGHKGTFGHVLVMGGCTQYVGAPIYTAKAAFHSGAGLVTLAVPKSIYPIAATQSPESLQIPLEDDLISEQALNTIDFSAYKVIAFGPGLGRNVDGEAIILNMISKLSGHTILIDADGLYFARGILNHLSSYDGNVIMTPHPGEMANLTGQTIAAVEQNRLQIAKDFACKHGISLLLKGHRSIIATPDGQVFVNPFGNDALGKGGSGDVLTGIVASFIAQGAEPTEALIAASYYHATAAEVLTEKYSSYGVTPSDIIEYVRKVL